MIDGALGMAYGVTATTFLTSVGISPLFATASVHSSEIFTSGVSGYMHLKFGNVNSRLFKIVLIPGVIGAALGAFLITKLANMEVVANYLSPAISVYTAILGILILKKALSKPAKKKPVRQIGLLAWFGGFVDAIGGWRLGAQSSTQPSLHRGGIPAIPLARSIWPSSLYRLPPQSCLRSTPDWITTVW